MPKTIFISYSHQDLDFALKLHERLKQCEISSWLDQVKLEPGDLLTASIRQGILNTDYLGVVISHHSIDSAWVKKETEFAVAQEKHTHRSKVVPICVDNCGVPASLGLGDRLHVDFSTSFEHGFGELINLLFSDRYNKQSDHCLVSGFCIAALFQCLYTKGSIAECEQELTLTKTALERAGTIFNLANQRKHIESIFDLAQQQRAVAIGSFASNWPDEIGRDLRGYNSKLFTFGTLSTFPLFYDSMTGFQLDSFRHKFEIAYENTLLPRRFLEDFHRSWDSRKEQSSFAGDKVMIEQFISKLVTYISLLNERNQSETIVNSSHDSRT